MISSRPDFSFARSCPARSSRPFDANIRRRYPVESAAWIWHPARLNETAFLHFRLPFQVGTARKFAINITADQRFQLFCDGRPIGFGPDRSDIEHWSFHTYSGWLEEGAHEFSALVWWIEHPSTGVRQLDAYDVAKAVTPPMAQASFRGGFLFSEDEEGERFNTGAACWQVSDLTDAVSLSRKAFPSYHAIGPSFSFGMGGWNTRREVDACIVREPVTDHLGGVSRPGWRLETPALPEQRRREFQGGRIRAVSVGQDAGTWTNLVKVGERLLLPAHESISVLWDLEDYLCGYPELLISGGKGAVIRWEWAEALYEASQGSPVTDSTSKGERDETEGKMFFGFGDEWLPDGGEIVRLPALWWRAGRYIHLEILTGGEPLCLEKLAVLRTGYPVDWEGSFTADDPELNTIANMCAVTMQAGIHETLVDSPYYEQLSYVGDNLVQALGSYVLSGDPRPARRSIELFDWSRQGSGLVAERWPSALRQTSGTYAMLWPQMVRNHAWWCDDEIFVRERMPGVRCLIETLLPFLNGDGSMGSLPGWTFVDWTNDWYGGYPPGHAAGDSALVTLHWIACLSAAEALEHAYGEPEMAARLQRLDAAAREAFRGRYWYDGRGLFTDDSKQQAVSEHTNALAAGLGLGGSDFLQNWPRRLDESSCTRCSVYFLHYFFEALAAGGHAAFFFQKLNLWRDFLKSGLLTIPEQPEPSRSDCHPWGTHPLFHFHATLAGIRPSSPGFRSVRVCPMPGPLRSLCGRLPHPKGEIHYDLTIDDAGIRGEIHLPPETAGEFVGAHGNFPLNPGQNVIPQS